MKYHVNSQDTKNDLIREVLNLPLDGSHTVEVKKTAKQRTSAQNRTIHKWFSYIADSFNNCGQSLNINGMEISPWWNADLIKELVFRPVMLQMVGKKSTAKCTVGELTEAIEAVAMGLESIGHYIAVPSREQLRNGK